MARARRGSSVLDVARQRLAGLKAITPAPDLGPALTLTGYEQELTAFSTSLDGYNEKLAALDELQNSVEAAEASLRDKNNAFSRRSKRSLARTAASMSKRAARDKAIAGAPQEDLHLRAPALLGHPRLNLT